MSLRGIPSYDGINSATKLLSRAQRGTIPLI